MSRQHKKLIVALDVGSFEEARGLIDLLCKDIDIFKVGSQLFTACGPVVIRHILAQSKEVFLDLKYHDIPNTVASAVASAVGLGDAVHQAMEDERKKKKTTEGILMLTIHICGGEEMLKKAVAEATKKAQNKGVRKPLIVGITVLTSEADADNIQNLVLERARLAKKCGLDGVVASSREASLIRKELGKDFIIVTPGIRPSGADAGDQERITTPREAIQNGSDYLVVGRPIIKSDDPLQAAKEIIEEINSV